MSGYGSLLGALGRGGDTMVAHINPYEAAVLKALGGSGAINPYTGLPEFDTVLTSFPSGTQPSIGNAPPVSSSYTSPDVAAGSSLFQDLSRSYGAPGGWALYPSDLSGLPTDVYVNSQGQQASDPQGQNITYSPSNAVPEGAPPTLDPAQVDFYSQVFQGGNLAGGGLGDPLGANATFLPNDPGLSPSAFQPGPNNPNFYQNPATGYYDLSPAGISALQGYYGTAEQSQTENAAKNASGIGGFLSTPLGAISILGLPLALGGGLEALGAVGGQAAGLGGEAAGVASEAAGAGAGAATAEAAGSTAPFLGATSSTAIDPSLEAAMAADLPSAGTGVATTGGAGIFGGATPDLAGITAAGAGLTGADGLQFAGLGGLVDPVTGALPTSMGETLGGTTPALAAPTDAGSQSVGLFGTTSQSVDPATVTTATEAGAGPGATVGEVGGGGGIPGDLATSDLAQFPGGYVAPPIPPEGGAPGFLDQVGNWASGLPGKVLSQIDKNPLGVLASVGGLGYTLFGGNNKNPPAANTLQGQASGLGTTASQLTQDVLSGNNPIPGVTQLQDAATRLQQQGATLQQQALSGNLPQEGAPQLLAQANQLTQQAATLRSYLQTGTLPPGLQAGISSAAAAAKAAIRSAYAQRGMSGSSAEAQDLSNVNFNSATQSANTAMQLFSQGLNEAQIADGVYSTLVNASTSLLQVGNQETALGIQAQQAAVQSSQNLLTTALNATGLSANINQALLQYQLGQDQQLGAALAAFASAMAGGTGSKIQLVNSGALA